MNARTATLALTAALAIAGTTRGQPNLKATYLFDDSLASEEAGPPPLVSVDPLGVNGFETATVFDQTRTVFHRGGDPGLETSSGLSLDATGLVPNDSYSLELVFSLTNLGGWCKLLDLRDRELDDGFYVNPDGRLAMWENDLAEIGVGVSKLAAAVFHHVVVTVAGTGEVKAYLNGALQFTIPSTTVLNLNAPDDLLHFFLDDAQTGGGEYSPGQVALIRLYQGTLSEAEVKALGPESGVATVTLIPYQDTGYRYRVVPFGEEPGSEAPEYDDSGFLIGDAGFGDQDPDFCPGPCPLTPATPWPLLTDIVLRKEFVRPPEVIEVFVGVAVDDSVQVFVNGVGIGAQGWVVNCPHRDSFIFTVPEELLNADSNLLAVRGSDFGCLSYLDVTVKANVPVEIEPRTVAIDLKPGILPNTIRLGTRGTVPVAILSSADFDALTVDPVTVTLAGSPVKLRANGAPQANSEDVNGDGLPDLVVHVASETLQLGPEDTEAVLEGTAFPAGALSRPFGGRSVRGVDSVRVVR